MHKTLLTTLLSLILLVACAGTETPTPAVIDDPSEFDFQDAPTAPPGTPTDETVLARNVIEDDAGDVDDPMLDVVRFTAILKTQRRIEIIFEVRDIPDDDYDNIGEAITLGTSPRRWLATIQLAEESDIGEIEYELWLDVLPPADDGSVPYIVYPALNDTGQGIYRNFITIDSESNTIMMRSRVPELAEDSVVFFVTTREGEIIDSPDNLDLSSQEEGR